MIITKKRIDTSQIKIKIDGTELEKCDSYKYLGVFFDKSLTWKTHIEYISKKISSSCGSLVKVRNCVDVDTLREIYHALIHSYIRYGIIAWGTAAKSSLKQLQVVMNRAMRIISLAPRGNIDLDPIYEILEILKLDDVYCLELAKFTFKEKNCSLPPNLAKFFEIRVVENNYRARSRPTNNEQIIHNTSIGLKSILVRSRDVWKKVPE